MVTNENDVISNRGFLHSHPTLERSLGVENNHVIVDVEDWEVFRKFLNEISNSRNK